MPLNEYDDIIQSGSVAPANEYDQIVLEGGAQQQQQVDGAKFVAAKRDPARWAKVLDISKRTNLPTDVVDRNFDKMQEIDHRQRSASEYDSLISDTPGLKQWLTNPDNATIGRDEIAALARVDRGSRVVSGGFGGSFEAGYHDVDAAAGNFAAIFGMGDPARIAPEVAAANKRSQHVRSMAPDYVGEFGAAMDAHSGDVNKAFATWLASQDDNGRTGIQKALDSFKTGAATLGETLELIGAAASRPRGLAYQVAEGFPSTIPMLVAGAIGGGIGNVPGLIGGVLIGGMLPSVGAELNSEMQKRGIDITNPDALLKAYSDPTLMAQLREKAARKGVTSSMVNALLAPLGGKFLETAEKAGAGAVGKALATGADVGVQAGGVAAGDVASQKAAGEQVNVGQAIQSGISTLGYAFGQEALGASRRGLLHEDPHKAAVDATTQATEALRATRDAQALAEIGTAVVEAKTTATVPESVKSLVEMATGGDPNANVYFQTKDWDEHFQAKGGSPAKAVADIMGDDGKAYYDAKTTGSAIVIPLSDYVARVAPTEDWGKLLPFARTKPDGMSLHEASDYLGSLPKTMEEIANESGNAQPAREAAAPDVSAARVADDVRAQLREAGVSPSVAKAQGALYESAFRTLGERAGRDPFELYSEYALKIKSENPRAVKEVPPTPPLSPEEVAARSELTGKAEGAIERDALSRPDPYLMADNMGELLKESFDLFQSAPGSESDALKPDAVNRYREIVKQIQAFPEERRQMLVSALKLPADILHLKQDERGHIIFGADRHVTIELLKNADRSTFLHETAHLYLEILSDLSKVDGANAGIIGDLGVVRDWLGADDSGKFTKAQHEQFARGFETYLMEGKAPSAKLRDAFYRFKRWLVSIYKDGSLGVELSPEVRKVFDRLLAVDTEIARAESDAKSQPLFADPKAVGMSDAEAESYQKAIADAHQAAEEALTTRMMKQIRREESAEWKAWRDPIEKDVTSDVNKRPEYRALSFLKDEKNPDGTPLDADTPTFKLSREAVVEAYGEEAAKALPRGVTAPDGLHPDLVADVFGYKSGRELIDAISKAPKRDAFIKSTTDARMQLEHGERLTELAVRDLASEAVRNEKREVVLRKELEVLASDHLATLKGLVRKVTKLVPPTEAIREEARRIIGAKPVRDVRPTVYEAAAGRLARESRDALLAGDIEKAFDLKRKELLTNEVFRSATKAKEEIESALDNFKKVFRRDDQLAKTRDMDLINAARSILAAFGIGQSDKPAFAYLEQMKRYDPEMYDTISGMVNEAIGAAGARGDYRSLSYDDFQTLRETIDSMWTLSRRSRQIEIDGKKLDRQQVQRELSDRIGEISKPKEKPGYKKAVTNWEKTKHYLMGAAAFLRRTEFWVDAMDSGKPDGAFRRYIWNPVSEGAAAYRTAKRSVLERYLEVVKPVEAGMKSGAIEAQEIGYEFKSKAELLGAILHTGNDSNLQKLIRGRGWGQFDEAGVLDRSRWDAFVDRMQRQGVLTKADYDYVQGVWNLFNELKPGAQKVHREMYGHYFSEITAKAFDTPFGRYEGGYYPALTDNFMVTDQALHREQESFLQGGNSFMFPTSGRGFTKSRVEGYAKPLMLDAGVVPLGFDAVLRFTHIEPRVRDVARVIMNREFRSTLDGFDPTIGKEMLVPWLQRSAQQRTQSQGTFAGTDKFWREVRSRTGLQILTANVVVALEQMTHLPGAAVKVPPAKLGAALWRFIRSPREVSEAIHEKSEYMRTRETAAVMEIQKTIDNLLLDPSKYQKARDFAREHGFFMSRSVQHMSDVMTWTGAYDHAIEGGADEKGAVRIADSAVRETQGSYSPEDLSRFETASPFLRTFSLFYSFFNAKANLLQTEFTHTIRDLGLRKGAGRLLYVYTFGFMLPAIFGHAIKQVATGEAFQHDDEGPVDAALRLLFGSQLEMASRMVPIVGPVTTTAVGAFTKKREDDDIMISPAVRMIESAVHAPGDVYKALHDRMKATRAIKDVLTLLGLLTNLPLGPLGKPVGYLNDVRTGKARPRSKYDFTRGLLTRSSGKK
ncbi:MAG: hypothetical protein JWL97_2980 [Gemmatimonadales bacterium]|nr:hypothetical protein [Gemmatimonadales bacterium]